MSDETKEKITKNDVDVPGFLIGLFGEPKYAYQHRLDTCKKQPPNETHPQFVDIEI